MPLVCAKSLRIQRHGKIADQSEIMVLRTQLETGLTGTPYAAALSDIHRYINMIPDNANVFGYDHNIKYGGYLPF
jgi:hypothetical protein